MQTLFDYIYYEVKRHIIILEGQKMYFENLDQGHKQTIILIHGAMFARSLERLRAPLSKDYNLVFVHMDGHGKEYESRFERDAIVDGIAEYIVQNNIKKPHLLGFSLGSQIALALANFYGKDFGKIALISPLIDATDSDKATIKFQMKALASIVKLKPFAKIASSMLSLEQDAKEEFYREQKAQNVTVLANDIMRERLNMSDLDNITSLKNEFFIATGLKDTECFVKSAVTLKRELKNSVLSTYTDCGHNIPITCHKRLNFELKNFFSN